VPSINHEALVVLFENRPALAGELLRLRGVAKAPSPKMDGSARLLSTSVAEVDLRQYGVDGVVLFGQEKSPDRVVVVEVQRGRDPNKRFSWPLLSRPPAGALPVSGVASGSGPRRGAGSLVR
jgi:hypothetical protein